MMIDLIVQLLAEIYNTTIMIAPYLLMGFLMSGILSVMISVENVAKYLGDNKSYSVFFASLFGVPLPLCSCGVIPVFSFLKKHGANKGAATSFLISTPQTGVDSIAITWGGLGMPFALSRAVIAFVSGIIGGTAINALDPKKSLNTKSDECQEDCCSEKERGQLYKILNYGFIKMPQDIGPSLIWGVLIASVIGIFVPDTFIMKYSEGILGMFIMLIAGIPLYMCATASVPIAVMLVAKGVTLGPILVFLMAGPATNMVTINIAKHHLGYKSTIIYLGSIIGCSLFFGSIIEYTNFGDVLKSGIPMHFHNHEHSHGLMDQIFALALVCLILNVYLMKYFKSDNKQSYNSTNQVVYISGMTCNHCVSSVEKTLNKLHSLSNVSVDLESGKVEFENSGVDLDDIKNEIIELGFKIKQ